MSDGLGMLLALLAFVLPIALAWILVGRSARRKPPGTRDRRRTPGRTDTNGW